MLLQKKLTVNTKTYLIVSAKIVTTYTNYKQQMQSKYMILE